MFWLAKCSLTCIELKCTEQNLQFVTSRNIWASFIGDRHGISGGQIVAICGEGHD